MNLKPEYIVAFSTFRLKPLANCGMIEVTSIAVLLKETVLITCQRLWNSVLEDTTLRALETKNRIVICSVNNKDYVSELEKIGFGVIEEFINPRTKRTCYIMTAWLFDMFDAIGFKYQ